MGRIKEAFTVFNSKVEKGTEF